MTKDEVLKLALETAEGIVKSDWRKWQELASPDEFERWVKSRALHMATAIKEALAQPEHSCVACEGNPKGNNNPCAVCGLAQPEQEPVAWESLLGAVARGWCYEKNANKTMDVDLAVAIAKEVDALYTTPPQRKPLTDVTIWNTYKNLWMFHPAEEPRLAGDVLKFARAIEQAHGIKD